jgi:tryptophan synthase beta chain
VPGPLQRLPDVIMACVGGGSNAAGMFFPFIEDAEVELIGVEAGGRGSQPGDHASTLSFGSPACCTAASATSCRTRTGRRDVHSISAGLDYPGVGPGTQLLEGHGPRPLPERPG